MRQRVPLTHGYLRSFVRPLSPPFVMRVLRHCDLVRLDGEVKDKKQVAVQCEERGW